MNPLILGPVLELGKDLIGRFFPDPEKRREAEAEFLKQAMDGELKQVIAQMEINAKEAMHPSVWVAGGRPFYLWVGGVGFAYACIVQPILTWVARIKGWPEPPEANNDLLWVVITGLLGISSLRSFEKTKGVASK
jgi:hypothetical protein